MIKNRSGQFVYFSLVSALSGNPVTGASGAISGRKSLDGLSGMIVLSGNIIELGGGSYRANLYDFDTNGDQVGYLFTASGCVPVQYQFDMIDGNGSGRFFLGSGSITSGLIASGIVFVASGPFVNTPRDTLSGLVVNSGLFVTVPIATISGAIANSGLFVTVPTATISGVVANSGLFVTVPKETISGVVANSGLSVIATLYSGSLNSGQTVAVYSGLFVTVPKETISGVVANSGLFVNAAVTVDSGLSVIATLYSGALNSGQTVAAYSGVWGTTSLNSGQSVLVYSGQLSGQQLTARTVLDKSGYTASLLSGTVYLASGTISVEVPEKLLTYNYSGAPDVSGQRNLLNATRKLINRFDLGAASGRLSVFCEDDSTLAYRQDVTAQSGTVPITQLKGD